MLGVAVCNSRSCDTGNIYSLHRGLDFKAAQRYKIKERSYQYLSLWILKVHTNPPHPDVSGSGKEDIR